MKGFLIFAGVLALALAAGALAAETQISEESVRIAIESFLQNPTASSESTRTIALFTEESSAVHVIVNLSVSCPYLREKYGHTGELMFAFVAGNVRSQLDSGVYGDDPYSGLLTVFRVYRHLKQANPEWTIPEIEKLLELHRQGKLAEHLSKEKERFTKEREQAVAAVALAAETQISEEAVRSAIESFLQNPAASADPELTIAQFMEKNKAVQIVIQPNGCYSWILDNKKYEHAVDLMFAFMAGNLRSQLDSGVYRSDPYSGLIAVFRVYRHLKKANPALTIPEVETLLELHRQGKLMEHLAKEKARATTESKQQN